MKNIVLSMMAVIAISSVGFADEYNVNDASERENTPEDKGFYLGLAYSHLSHDIDHEGLTINFELDFYAVMFDVGYKFNPYIAVEGRYNLSLGDTALGDTYRDDRLAEADLSVLSFFVKPMYPIAPEMDIYVLLGYSLINASYSVNATSLDEGAFSWGAGASYDITEDFAIFAEYTRFYDDTLSGFDHVVDSFNVGVNYKF